MVLVCIKVQFHDPLVKSLMNLRNRRYHVSMHGITGNLEDLCLL